jgi:hypothetical protein
MASLALAACGEPDACRGLSDADAVDRLIADYNRTPATQKGDPAQMQFTRARVAGIGRGAQPSLTQVWFRQDDGTLTAATLMQDCQSSFRPGLAPGAIKDAVYPASAPRF